MPTPLESNFLVPNASFLITGVVVLIVVLLVLAGVIWLVSSRRKDTSGPDSSAG